MEVYENKDSYLNVARWAGIFNKNAQDKGPVAFFHAIRASLQPHTRKRQCQNCYGCQVETLEVS
jgi:hypothetical protein